MSSQFRWSLVSASTTHSAATSWAASGLPRLEGHLHRLHEGLADVPDHQPSGRLRLGIQAEAREHVLDDAHVVLRLLEVLLPLLLEVLVHDAAKGGLVDLHAAQFGLERLVQKFVDFFVLHGAPPSSGVLTERQRASPGRWRPALVSNSIACSPPAVLMVSAGNSHANAVPRGRAPLAARATAVMGPARSTESSVAAATGVGAHCPPDGSRSAPRGRDPVRAVAAERPAGGLASACRRTVAAVDARDCGRRPPSAPEVVSRSPSSEADSRTRDTARTCQAIRPIVTSV